MPALPELSPRATAFGAMTFDSMQLSESIFAEIYNDKFQRHDFLKDPPLTVWHIFECCDFSTAIKVMSATSGPRLPHKPKDLLRVMVQTFGDVLMSPVVLPSLKQAKLWALASMLQKGHVRHQRCFYRAASKRYDALGRLRYELDGSGYHNAMAEYHRTMNSPLLQQRKPKPEGEPPVVDQQKVAEVQRQRSFITDVNSALTSLSLAMSNLKQSGSYISWDTLLKCIVEVIEAAEAPYNNQGNYHTAIRYQEDKQRGIARMFVIRTFWNLYAAWCPIEI
jgi:hypothetical protein